MVIKHKTSAQELLNAQRQSEMTFEMFIYALIGFGIDVLATIDIKAVQLNRAFMSANVSLVNGVLYYTVLVNVILSPDRMLLLGSYLFGGYVGTIFIIKSNFFR